MQYSKSARLAFFGQYFMVFQLHRNGIEKNYDKWICILTSTGIDGEIKGWQGNCALWKDQYWKKSSKNEKDVKSALGALEKEIATVLDITDFKWDVDSKEA